MQCSTRWSRPEEMYWIFGERHPEDVGATWKGQACIQEAAPDGNKTWCSPHRAVQDVNLLRDGRTARAKGRTVRTPDKILLKVTSPRRWDETSASTTRTKDVRSRVPVGWHTGCVSGAWAPMTPKITRTGGRASCFENTGVCVWMF